MQIRAAHANVFHLHQDFIILGFRDRALLDLTVFQSGHNCSLHGSLHNRTSSLSLFNYTARYRQCMDLCSCGHSSRFWAIPLIKHTRTECPRVCTIVQELYPSYCLARRQFQYTGRLPFRESSCMPLPGTDSPTRFNRSILLLCQNQSRSASEISPFSM